MQSSNNQSEMEALVYKEDTRTLFEVFESEHLKKNNKNNLVKALQKIKEGFSTLVFIAFMMVFLKSHLAKVCISENLAKKCLPCGSSTAQSFNSFDLWSPGRLFMDAPSSPPYCEAKGKVPLYSITTMHYLFMFNFIFGVVYAIFVVLTILLGAAKMRQWEHWERFVPNQVEAFAKIRHLRSNHFRQDKLLVIINDLLGWLHLFLKQFYGSVFKADYLTLRVCHILSHNSYNFHEHKICMTNSDVKQVVGTSWYLWPLCVILLLQNLNGWHAYIWIAFIPFILLLAVGTKLEHVMTKSVDDARKDPYVFPRRLVFYPCPLWFRYERPWIVPWLIHFVLIHNSFELAFFIWIWIQYGFNSCIMGETDYIIPRLVIGGLLQIICGYNILPLYVIVKYMGSSPEDEQRVLGTQGRDEEMRGVGIERQLSSEGTQRRHEMLASDS